jgi:acetoin utilization deacetylase AcuC-like enzyme
MVGYFYHKLFQEHLQGFGHVEQPARLAVIRDEVEKSEIAASLKFIEAKPAQTDWLTLVHDFNYVNRILTLDAKDAVALDWGDTFATAATPQAALHAAGCGIQAAQLVLDREIASAFCAVRPPGHHAIADQAMGFCIFNNIAVVAAYLTRIAGLSRVAIIDWDVHHGNGTEDIFAEDKRIFYISLHQYPHYPGTGHADMRGKREGEGFTLNLPMGAAAGDREYLHAIDNKIIPALKEFKPEFILISAGFDAHGDDPLSDIGLSTNSYYQMTQRLAEFANNCCRGRIVSMLEGGYNLDSLAASAKQHLKALTEAETDKTQNT